MRVALQVCVVLWPVAIIAIGWRHRPPFAGREAGPGFAPAITRQIVGDGRWIRCIGVVLCAFVLWRIGGWIPIVVLGGMGLWLRRAVPRRRRQARRQLLLRELPEVVDFYRVALGGGLTPLAATAVVARRLDGVVPLALAQCVHRVALGAPFAGELETLPAEVGEEVRGLSRLLISAERHGVPAVAALEQLGVEVRLQRRREAEIAARKLPVKLLFPLVVCTLPAFVLLTVVPIAVTSFRSIATP